MATSKSAGSQVRLSDDLTPEQVQRLRAAVRLVVNYLLDSALPNCKKEIQKDIEQTNEPSIRGATSSGTLKKDVAQ